MRKPSDSGDEISFELHAFDLSRRTARLVATDVSPDVSVAADRTVVFSRATAKPDTFGVPRRLVMIETGYRVDAIAALLAFARDAEPRWRFK